MELTENNPKLGTLSELQPKYLEELRKKLDDYFPEDRTQEMSIFDHRKWQGLTTLTIKSKFKKACTCLRLAREGPKLQTEFANLLKSLRDDTIHLEEFKDSSPVSFWEDVLRKDAQKDDERDVKITDPLKKIIQIAILIPMGGAQAERSFSVMNNVG